MLAKPSSRTVACAVLYSIVAVAAVAPHLLSVGASQVGLVRASTAVSGVVHWATPTLVGWSNSSQPLGSNFWFPSISIATGLNGTVAQHITLSGDGGTCPPAGHPQVMRPAMCTCTHSSCCCARCVLNVYSVVRRCHSLPDPMLAYVVV